MSGFLRFLGLVGLSVKYYYLNTRITETVARKWVDDVCRKFDIEIQCYGKFEHDQFVVLANHESYFDIPALYKCCDKRLVWVAKEELFKVPIVGHALRDLDAVSVDRFDDFKSARAILKLLKNFDSGGIAIFPQGSRMEKGAFHMGGVFLAKKRGLPIYPVKISGTGRIMPVGKATLNRGNVFIRIFKPLDASLYSQEDIKKRVRELIYD